MPFTAALGNRNTQPASGAMNMRRSALGVGMHQYIAAM